MVMRETNSDEKWIIYSHLKRESLWGTLQNDHKQSLSRSSSKKGNTINLMGLRRHQLRVYAFQLDHQFGRIL